MTRQSTGNPANASRRRTLKILAAAGGTLATLGSGLAAPRPFVWRGNALGASASVTAYGIGEAQGQSLMRRIADELRRLERVFSLYRTDSALTALNKMGTLSAPPLDLVRVMYQARAVSEATQGSFDVTVQPLWELNAQSATERSAVSLQALDAVMQLIDYRQVDVGSRLIRLNRPGMAVTLNGIAQGYITDRIADLLRAQGLRSVLVDLGEIRALDAHPTGQPWSVGLKHPTASDGFTSMVPLTDGAVATSAGAGTVFSADGSDHHIFDPSSGRSANVYASFSVIGKRATTADALSTGLYNLSPRRARAVLAKFPGYYAMVTYPHGRSERWL